MNITGGQLVLGDREVAINGLQIILDEGGKGQNGSALPDWRGHFRLNAEQRRRVGNLAGEAKIIFDDRRSGPVLIDRYNAISGEASFTGAGELK
ncbi:MAG: hypothetical protein JWL97_550 [Gemmatimonadales bacterium]|jgi:hypothetical protein|nr:hypothetical protein [Gemmatimonadales bacterium]